MNVLIRLKFSLVDGRDVTFQKYYLSFKFSNLGIVTKPWP